MTKRAPLSLRAACVTTTTVKKPCVRVQQMHSSRPCTFTPRHLNCKRTHAGMSNARRVKTDVTRNVVVQPTARKNITGQVTVLSANQCHVPALTKSYQPRPYLHHNILPSTKLCLFCCFTRRLFPPPALSQNPHVPCLALASRILSFTVPFLTLIADAYFRRSFLTLTS